MHVETDIDPRLERFTWDLNALCEWELRAGKPLSEARISPTKDREVSMLDLRMLVWCGLRSQCPEVSLEDVGRMITPRNAARVRAVIDRAILAGSPDMEVEGKN
jgi:hypothetical protein